MEGCKYLVGHNANQKAVKKHLQSTEKKTTDNQKQKCLSKMKVNFSGIQKRNSTYGCDRLRLPNASHLQKTMIKPGFNTKSNYLKILEKEQNQTMHLTDFSDS